MSVSPFATVSHAPVPTPRLHSVNVSAVPLVSTALALIVNPLSTPPVGATHSACTALLSWQPSAATDPVDVGPQYAPTTGTVALPLTCPHPSSPLSAPPVAPCTVAQ